MLEFRILGPIEVLRDGQPLPLGGAKQRALVADLTLHANEVVSADRLVDDLWRGDPPDTSAHMLHVYVSRLRKTLEDHGRGVLVTRAPGYLLRLEPPDELDAARFEAHVRRGAEALGSRPADALETLDAALGWWRGRALEEFADDGFAQPSASRLEELREAAHEHRVEALLALGRHDEAVVELEGLIARFPLRERLRELQMLALYRSGRQADALQASRSARRTLAEELGVDPGPGLMALEQAILRHDAELQGPTAPVPAAEPPAVPQPPAAKGTHEVPQPRTRRRWVRAAMAVAVAAGVVLLIVARVVAPTGSPETTPSDTPPGGGEPGAERLIQWTEAPDPGGRIFGGPGDQVILGGVTTPDGTLAVGYTATQRPSVTEPRDYDATVWMQTGSAGWHTVTDTAFAAPGNQEATDATVVDGRLVVVGSDASPGDHDAAVWTQEEGSTSWSRVDPESPGMREAGDQWVRGATWTGTRVVAVGFNRLHGDDDAAIWTSSDALDWTLLVPSNLGAPGDQQMITVTTFGHLIVAAGFDASSDDRDAAVWVSRDGADWDPVDELSLGGDGDQQINAVIPGGPGLVAVGQETVAADENAAVWVSADGLGWERVADPTGALGGPGSQQMSAVASSGDLLVAAGADVVEAEIDGAVWTSADGTTWSRSPADSPEMSTFTDFGRQGVRALLEAEEGFVALGREGRGGDDDADVWLGRFSDES